MVALGAVLAVGRLHALAAEVAAVPGVVCRQAGENAVRRERLEAAVGPGVVLVLEAFPVLVEEWGRVEDCLVRGRGTAAAASRRQEGLP